MFEFSGKNKNGKGGRPDSLLNLVQDQPESLLDVVVPFQRPANGARSSRSDSLLNQLDDVGQEQATRVDNKRALQEAEEKARKIAILQARLRAEKAAQEKAAIQAERRAAEEAEQLARKQAEAEASRRFKAKADFLEEQIERVRKEKIQELNAANESMVAREAREKAALEEVARRDEVSRHYSMDPKGGAGQSQAPSYQEPPSHADPNLWRGDPSAYDQAWPRGARQQPNSSRPVTEQYREQVAPGPRYASWPTREEVQARRQGQDYHDKSVAHAPHPEDRANWQGRPSCATERAAPAYNQAASTTPPFAEQAAYDYHPADRQSIPPQAEQGLYDPEPEGPQIIAGHGQYSNEDPAPSFNMDKLMRTVLQSWKLIAFMALLGAALAGFYAMTLPNKYQAWAELIIDPSDIKVLENQLSPSGYSGEAMVAYLESQLRIIESSSVLNKVIEDQGLLGDKEFNGKGSGPASWWSRIFPPPQSVREANEKQKVLEKLQDALTIVRGNRTFIYSIGIMTRDAAKSARIANSVASSYVRGESIARSKVALDTSENLKGKLKTLAARVLEAEKAVADYRARNKIFSSEGKLTSEVQLSLLNEQLAAAKVATINAKARMEQAQTTNLSDVISGALPSSLNTNTMSQLRVRYARLKSNADKLATKLGRRHPERIAAEAELASARAQTLHEIKRIISGTVKEYKRAQSRQRSLARQVNALKATSSGVGSSLIELHQLEREAAAHRRVYENYLLRSRETAEQKGLKTSNARIISKATPPLKKASPRRKIFAVLGLIAGALLGLLIAVMKGLMPSVRKQDDPRLWEPDTRSAPHFHPQQAYGAPTQGGYPGYPVR